MDPFLKLILEQNLPEANRLLVHSQRMIRRSLDKSSQSFYKNCISVDNIVRNMNKKPESQEFLETMKSDTNRGEVEKDIDVDGTTPATNTFYSKALVISPFQSDYNGSTLKTDSKDTSCSPGIDNDSRNMDMYPVRTLSGYRALTNTKIKSPDPSITFYVKELKTVERERKFNHVETLREKASYQIKVLQQISKALFCCYSSEKLRISPERVECERFLLLALQRYSSMTKIIEHLKEEIKNGCILKAENGTVQVSNISICFNEIPLPHIQNEESQVWILCVLSCDENVLATEAKLLKQDPLLTFKECFSFSNLLNDFNIKVQFYILTLKRSSCTSKRYLKKLISTMSTHTLGNQSSHQISESSDSEILDRKDIFREPEFQLKGSFIIDINNLKSSVRWNELSFAQLQMSLNWDVVSKVETSGFLTVTEENDDYHIWERRWCYLEACKLKYWNYPAEKEHMPAINELDLRNCLNAIVEPLDRCVCPRPRTFQLEFSNKCDKSIEMNDESHKTHTSTRYLFSADTKKDLLQWCMVFNKNLNLLRTWKKI